MEVGLLCSRCEPTSSALTVMASSSPQIIRSCSTTASLLNVRRDSSSKACSSFSCVLPLASNCAGRFLGVLRQQSDEQQGGHVTRRGPGTPRSRGGVGGDGSGPGKPRSTHISPPGLGQFRPPPSTYVPNYKESEAEKQNADLKKSVLLEELRDGHGSWPERAGLVKELQQLGVTSEDLYNQTYVPIVQQLEMVVAAQVYESLVQSGTSQEVLQWFDEDRLTFLYALRTLSARQRRSAAEYVVEKSLSVEEAQKLAWAIKDHERRPTGRSGFTPAPGDCLAFMYYRQVIESQGREQKQILVEQGLKVAVTDSAKERFLEFL